MCCVTFALFVCLTLLASFFLPSHLSFKNMYIWKVLNAVQNEIPIFTVRCSFAAYDGSYAPDITQAVSHYRIQPQLQTCVMYCMYTEHNAAPKGIPSPHLPHTIIHVHL